MIDSSLLKTDQGRDALRKSLTDRQEADTVVDKLSEMSIKRSKLITSSETLQGKRNAISKDIATIKNENPEKVDALKNEVRSISEDLKKQKEELLELDQIYSDTLLTIPNVLDKTVPVGADEKSNVSVRQVGEIPEFPAKPHFEVAEEYGLVDFERGVKLSGSRYYVYNEDLSKLERALTNFMLGLHEKAGYKERTVPFLVNNEAMLRTGQFPKFADEYYQIERDGLNLIPTAEVPLTNLYADEIVSEKDLPIQVCSLTPCFRREAGSAGKDTRGLVRVHQFMKVELVKFVKPENSADELQKLTGDAERVLQELDLTYRVIFLCSGDTSFSSSLTYDIEVWMPGLKRWLEISSCSNFKDFQARRAKIRYKDDSTGKNTLVHTLNGSGVAAGRLIAALMEYHQAPDGSIDFDSIYQKLQQ